MESSSVRRPRAITTLFLRKHPILVTALALFLAFAGVVTYFYLQFARQVGERLAHGSLRTNSAIYAAPRLLAAGDAVKPEELIGRLQRAGYTDRSENRLGYYVRTANGLQIVTGPESYYQPHAVEVQFKGDHVARIVSRTENKPVDQYWLEPELVTNVLDEGRGKRLPVAYSEFPQHLVQAVVSIEDKRFFNHAGLDLLRIAKAAYVDIREGRKEQGLDANNAASANLLAGPGQELDAQAVGGADRF